MAACFTGWWRPVAFGCPMATLQERLRVTVLWSKNEQFSYSLAHHLTPGLNVPLVLTLWIWLFHQRVVLLHGCY
jgi:hypothetical protein